MKFILFFHILVYLTYWKVLSQTTIPPCFRIVFSLFQFKSDVAYVMNHSTVHKVCSVVTNYIFRL